MSEHENANMATSLSQAAQADSPTEVLAIAQAWLAGTITSADAIQDALHPFFVHSCNKSGFKYKYPEAAPTPEGEDDAVWNKTYTAADSRMYNKHGKDANQSKKYRASRETYELCLRIHLENKSKFAKKHGGQNPLDAGDALADKNKPALSKATPKQKPAPSKAGESSTNRSSFNMDNSTDDLDLSSMSIYEKVKSNERTRKPSSTAALPFQSSPGPSTAGAMSNPAPKIDYSAPPKAEKVVAKKKGTAATVKKSKKAKPEAGKSKISVGTLIPTANPSAEDSDSNDGGEYCICRGPDDHRMMVFCEGGCEDWYHCSCLVMNEADVKELLDRFICPKCTTDKLFTTWKPMCRYYNIDKTHRKAARVTGASDKSKYCSKKCGLAYVEFVIDKLARKDDTPSMGGVINNKELAMLVQATKGKINEIHKLGEKPRLPVAEGDDPSIPVGLKYVTADEQIELNEIKEKMADIKGQIKGYDLQVELLNMINDRAKTAAKHPSLEFKDICGYDNRLAMNDAEFSRWCRSEEAKKAFEAKKLGPRTAETMDIGAITPYPGQVIPPVPEVPDALNNICLKKAKKCIKHFGWREMYNQDFRYMQKQLEVALKKLVERETEIIEDAEIREATKEYNAHNVTIQYF